jgi:hypothetical protein
MKKDAKSAVSFRDMKHRMIRIPFHHSGTIAGVHYFAGPGAI